MSIVVKKPTLLLSICHVPKIEAYGIAIKKEMMPIISKCTANSYDPSSGKSIAMPFISKHSAIFIIERTAYF